MINSAKVERYYPAAGTVLITAFAIILNFDLKLYSSIVTSAFTITAIFIGFIGTLAGIILTSNSKATAFMQRINKLSVLYSYIWGSLQLSFVFVFYCILIEVYPPLLSISLFFSWLWAALGSYSLLLIHRSITVSITLLKSAALKSNTD